MSHKLPDDWYEEHSGQSLVLNYDKVGAVVDTIRTWQRARREIFAYPMKATPDEKQLDLWRALGDAEHALMDI